MKSSTITAILAFTSSALAACSREGSVELTFFGYPDNDPPSAQTAYNCGGRNYVASEGDGTYNNPVTMASAQGEFSSCEIAYVPYLKKYVRYEDYCQECTDDFNNSGKRHIDGKQPIWTGSSTSSGGQDQINCEDSLTPSGNVVIIRSPGTNYDVDTAPLYHQGTSNACRTNHVYPNEKAHTYCP